MKEIKLRVNGMHCYGCENRIDNAIKEIKGVTSVKANHTDGNVVVTYQDDLSLDTIKETIEDLGFQLEDN